MRESSDGRGPQGYEPPHGGGAAPEDTQSGSAEEPAEQMRAEDETEAPAEQAARGEPAQTAKDGGEASSEKQAHILPDDGATQAKEDATRAKDGGEAAPAKQGALARLVLKLCFGNRRLAEIARFVIVGVIATLVDFIASGVVLYIFDPSLYTQFTDIFSSEGATVLAQCVSTGVGFIFGVAVNYVLSVFFVFEEKGNSRTALGFILFVLLSAGGLAINVVGMYLLVDLAGWNYWLIKILLTCVVLVYNYLTRKFIIFRKRGKKE